MSRYNYQKNKNDKNNYTHTFICRNCNMTVSSPECGGVHRNHCPHCLWSLHLDFKKGDRRCGYQGQMEPITKLPFPAKNALEKIV